ncbi:MAG: prenyltransferase/squalene oxidase repeat-containing protein [Gaiellaceae bacterium]
MGLIALAAAATLLSSPVAYLQSRQLPDGGFAEPGGTSSPQLTAWAAVGLRAAGAKPRPGTLAYLRAHEGELANATDIELGAIAETVLGGQPSRLLARIDGLRRPNGSIGANVNSTIWGILALRQARRRAPAASVRYLLGRQVRSGGWSWSPGGQPDSNDTAAAIEALRAAGVGGAPIRRAVRYLRRLQNRDGGFELTPGRGSDAQSTAWAVQALASARAPVPSGAMRYLQRLRRADGSFRYSVRYVTTPVWVTAQVLPALARRPLPLPL